MRINQFSSLLAFVVIAPVANLCYANYQSNDNPSIQIGKCIPEITFDNVINLSPRKFSTKSVDEKPIIMYFFSTACRASFQHFPEMHQMYSAHKQNFNLILIGIDLEDNVRGIYEKYSQKYDLNLPVTFDKTVYKQYHINSVPHVIWIDKNGTVQAITNVVDQGYLKQFIEGKEFDFISYSPEGNAKLRDFNPDEPFLLNGNGGEAQDFVQRSLLSEWKIGMPIDMPWAESNKSPLEGLKFLQVIGRELADLYRIAHFGKTYAWHPGDSAYGNYHYSLILEIEDKFKFESDYNLGKNLFCYSQILPPEKRNPAQMMEVMQRDLKNFLGYDVVVETRMMRYLSMVATDKARMKLINRGKSDVSSSSLTHVDFTNKSITSLISFLSYNLNLVLNDLPLIDEMGIHGNIDIAFSAIMTDLMDVKRALQKQGLDIVQKERPMKVIVIRDPYQE
jgi:hypothetical protein